MGKNQVVFGHDIKRRPVGTIGIAAGCGDGNASVRIGLERTDVVAASEIFPIQDSVFESRETDRFRMDCRRTVTEIQTYLFQVFYRERNIQARAATRDKDCSGTTWRKRCLEIVRVENLEREWVGGCQLDRNGDLVPQPCLVHGSEGECRYRHQGKSSKNFRFHFPPLNHSLHRHLRICLPVDHALKCVAPPMRGDSDVGNSMRFRRAL